MRGTEHDWGDLMGLRVGLDVGITSVGWCVIDPDAERIVGAGVRIFQAAEIPKTGASLAGPRREARSVRRRLRRRHARMEQFRDLVISNGLLSPQEFASTFQLGANDKSPYELRVEGLDRQLTNQEWVRVLSQLCKRRGYKSMRLSDRNADDEGVVKAAIAENEALMLENGYRTVGEMILMDAKFASSKRNKGDYKGVVSREQLMNEIEALFRAQRRLGSMLASPALEQQYLEVLNSQARIKEGDELLSLVGKCSIDKTNKRIPAACYTFERFRAVDKLNNLRFRLVDGTTHGLGSEQRTTILDRVFGHKTPQTYENVRKVLKLPDDARFIGVRYDSRKPDDVSAEKKERLPYPKAWQAMRAAVSAAVSDKAWDTLAADEQLLDRIGFVLTYYKYDDSVVRELSALGLDDATVEALKTLRFSGNGHLSRETLLAILPGMESGMSYSDACEAVGLHHSLKQGQELQPKLPPVPDEEIRNPVVVRALSQTRKVINAIIHKYGPIEGLNIELGRDVAKNRRDRDQIDKDNRKRRVQNEEVLDELRTAFGMSHPRGLDLIKQRLWKEQGGRCVYSGHPIDPARLFSGEPGVAEVDHILPHSRSFDDSYMNKVLVTTAENRNKGERTPYEYLQGDAARLHEFEERVESMHLPRPKRERLLKKDFDERASEEFRERNLNDTRYIARFLKNFVEDNLQFAGHCTSPVMTINGRATAYLRTAWQFQKVRADGDLHHAMDAIVIAAATRGMVQKVSRFYSARQLRNHDGRYVDKATGEIIDAKHVPEPWTGFREQAAERLNARFSDDPVVDLETPEVEPKPILVSRMPSRVVRGEAHRETIRRIDGLAEDGRIITSKRVKLESLTPALLERMVGRRHGDRALYQALADRLNAFDGNGAKAFSEPFHKPSKPGRVAPRVHSIRVEEDPSSGGVEVRGGLADNGTMVRTDVFERDGKFYLIPVYMKDVAAGALPMKAIVAFKAEADWRDVDDSYRFAFSLHMNDLVRIVKKSREGADTWFGYFKGTDRSDGGIRVQPHDASTTTKKLGVAQGVVSFDKYEVDVLGTEVHRVKREIRRGFSNRGRIA